MQILYIIKLKTSYVDRLTVIHPTGQDTQNFPCKFTENSKLSRCVMMLIIAEYIELLKCDQFTVCRN